MLILCQTEERKVCFIRANTEQYFLRSNQDPVAGFVSLSLFTFVRCRRSLQGLEQMINTSANVWMKNAYLRRKFIPWDKNVYISCIILDRVNKRLYSQIWSYVLLQQTFIFSCFVSNTLLFVFIYIYKSSDAKASKCHIKLWVFLSDYMWVIFIAIKVYNWTVNITV